jgi:sirohydrochlorin cobaltochelatase
MLDEMGRQDVRIGTVEAPEVLDELIGSVQALGVSKVVLSPFMVVAGDHALNDMSGPQKTSWKSRFEQAGFTVSCILRGLGEYPAIRSIYVKHARRNPA